MKTFTTSALLIFLATLAVASAVPSEEESLNLFSRFHYVPNVLSARAAAPLTPAKIRKNNADIAHGTLMGIAVVLLLPIGAMVMRMSNSKNLTGIHVFCQVFGLIVLLAGFGTGVYTSFLHANVYTDPHTYYGTVVVGFFLIQPCLGLLHHLGWVRRQSRTIFTYMHIWWGRIILVLAVVNGGYGILYANNSVPGQKGYGVVAGIVGVVYVALAALWYARESRIREAEAEKKGYERGLAAGSGGVEVVDESGSSGPRAKNVGGVEEKMV